MKTNENIKLLPRVVECADCGEPFVITSPERQFYLDRLLKEPKRCPNCRQRRRATINSQDGG